jgi:hypothetical protein
MRSAHSQTDQMGFIQLKLDVKQGYPVLNNKWKQIDLWNAAPLRSLLLKYQINPRRTIMNYQRGKNILSVCQAAEIADGIRCLI